MTEPKDYNIDELINNARCDDHRCSKVQDLNAKLKAQLYELITKEIIGSDLDEEDGWNWAFSEKAQCCPGDDFSYFANHIKKKQRQKLSDLFNIKENK